MIPSYYSFVYLFRINSVNLQFYPLALFQIAILQFYLNLGVTFGMASLGFIESI